jgi:branched-chain amino acid transport system substrate-binding protein
LSTNQYICFIGSKALSNEEFNMNILNALWLILGFTLISTAQAVPRDAAAGQTINVGQLASKTHPLTSGMANDYVTGIELAFKRVNAQGGIKGRSIKLLNIDDNFDANKSVELVEQLVAQNDVMALVGNMGTLPLLKLAEQGTLEKHSLASFAPMTGLQSALDKPNVFALRASYEDEVLAMLKHTSQLGRGKVVYLYFEAGVGIHLAKLAPEMATQAKVQLLGVKGFAVTKDRAQQEAAAADALNALNGSLAGAVPQAVVLIAIGGAHSEAVKAVRKHYGMTIPIYSLGQINPATLIKDVGGAMATGVMLTQVMPVPNGIDLAIQRDFQNDLHRFASGQSGSYFGFEGYIAGRLMAEILRRTKTLSRQAVLQTSLQAGVVDLGGYRVSYSPKQRKSLHRVELTMISRDGKLIR